MSASELPRAGTSKPASETVTLRQWVAVFGAVLGAFMAVLDIQITNASLAEITGSLAATLDEGAWISTAYLVAEIIVIPLTAWLAGAFGTRRYLMGNAICFLVASVACGFAHSLSAMIVCRLLQGLAGGVLIPMAFTIILRTLPPSQRATGFALFGITATFAPSVGPTIGGWLTEAFGWPSIFYLNVIPGILLCAAIYWSLDDEPMHLNRLKNGDWAGITTMAIGLGALTVFLEEGNRNDWFECDWITELGIVATTFLASFLIIEWLHPRPLVNLRLFQRRNFGFAGLTNIALGIGLYGLSYVLPVYLAQVQHYNSTQIGETIMWMGWPQLVLMPFVARALMPRYDPRLLVTIGMSLFGGSALLNGWMSHDTGHDQLIISQALRAFGQPLIMVPLTSIATAGIEPAQAGNASALFNMMRNLGGSVGIALGGTLISVRERFHGARLGEMVTEYGTATQMRLSQLTAVFMHGGNDAYTAVHQAMTATQQSIRREAFVMAFDDCFLLLGTVLLLSGATIWCCRRADGKPQAPAH